ncbi:carboxy terminal-processing peptidase [Pedobacter rhizosphaerae]|uniref:Carboxyl-terminal processing protease n=1 Tax=Pedobacter rhizosphaerae TaxID=390241 RepID=A0A1H9KRN3_9SPHI|nr:carboxy terminal-processing peptidase [Pedobacter rhizosphaerae]SER01738.1 carboxyl-terminal processing protease [Pedobacter rhizosphaerae]
MTKTNYFTRTRYFTGAAIACAVLLPLLAKAQEPSAGEIQKATILAVVKNLKENHVHPKPIDDNFSKTIWKKFLEGLDPNKDVFLKSDFEDLKQYQLTVDEALNEGNAVFFNAAFERYQQRLHAAAEGYQKVLSTPFDFTLKESVQLYGKLRDYASTETELQNVWRQRAKYLVLRKMMELDKTKMNSPELEKQARTKIERWLSNSFKNLTGPTAQSERFSQFLSTVTLQVEPHTQYIAPVQLKMIDASMAKRFYGIGLELQEKEGDVFVKTVRPGGMAMRSGKIEANDRIVSISNTAGEMVDVVGMSGVEVGGMIRGDKDTRVSLGLMTANGTLKTVSLMRAEINEEETKAKSAIIEKNGKKIGYLFLREFYVDVNNPKGAHAAIDFRAELLKLKEAKVAGVVVDLRDNPGGSLDEVVDIAGFFLGAGPKVLVKEVNALFTPTTTEPALYTGPLVVMMNEHSASASEIFAAAIQDHKRGLIIGAPASFGKGTAQPTLPMGKMGDRKKGIPNISYGSLRISQFQFYRVTGASTQSKGVLSDIVLPGKLAYLESREKYRDAALAWDSISPAAYQPVRAVASWNKMKNLGRAAVGQINIFKNIDEKSKLLAEEQLKSVSLNPAEFVKQQQVLLNYTKQIDAASQLPANRRLKVLATPNGGTAVKDWYAKWTKELSTDIYIDKSIDIINSVMTVK